MKGSLIFKSRHNVHCVLHPNVAFLFFPMLSDFFSPFWSWNWHKPQDKIRGNIYWFSWTSAHHSFNHFSIHISIQSMHRHLLQPWCTCPHSLSTFFIQNHLSVWIHPLLDIFFDFFVYPYAASIRVAAWSPDVTPEFSFSVNFQLLCVSAFGVALHLVDTCAVWVHHCSPSSCVLNGCLVFPLPSEIQLSPSLVRASLQPQQHLLIPPRVLIPPVLNVFPVYLFHFDYFHRTSVVDPPPCLGAGVISPLIFLWW